LSTTDHIRYSTTQGTNALVERKGPRLGLILTGDLDAAQLQRDIQEAMGETEMIFIEVPDAEVPIADAVKCYLFNSQLISMPGRDGMALILPIEVSEMPSAKAYVDQLLASELPINHVDYLDVRQSMRNGGGPACLRLRVVLSQADRVAMAANSILDDGLLASLQTWAKKHYRDRLMPEDLGDVALMEEGFAALDDLTQILKLGSVYDFQR
ncbi:MAG: N-succinylarginine dihydrolase, partial [Kordiimonadaceae bacterium]|nr:N-succinylarginine dihydrolase [Kordiimonadaceae bacterium]